MDLSNVCYVIKNASEYPRCFDQFPIDEIETQAREMVITHKNLSTDIHVDELYLAAQEILAEMAFSNSNNNIQELKLYYNGLLKDIIFAITKREFEKAKQYYVLARECNTYVRLGSIPNSQYKYVKNKLDNIKAKQSNQEMNLELVDIAMIKNRIVVNGINSPQTKAIIVDSGFPFIRVKSNNIEYTVYNSRKYKEIGKEVRVYNNGKGYCI